MQSGPLVPVACRFVPYDQWLITHLDDGWKVSQVKHWILSKCNPIRSKDPPTQRPVSPITFSSSIPSRASSDSLDDGCHEGNEYSDDQDLPPRHPASRRLDIYPLFESSALSVQPGTSPLVDQYTLISFSTGSVLEDDFTLSWYNFRPYELLEMHPVGTVASLPREVLADYIQPYFQAKVRLLRAVWNPKSARFEAPRISTHHELNGCKGKEKDKFSPRLDAFSQKSTNLQPEKKRKVDWKTRWVVINQGVLSLCQGHAAGPPLHQFLLSTMRALCGADALGQALSISTQPRVVCIKFRVPQSASVAGVTSPPSMPSSPISDDGKSSVTQDLKDTPLPHACGLQQTTEQEHSRNRSGQHVYDPNELCKGEGDWIVLDMLHDHAYSSILRILHRQTSHPISSSFVPSSSIMTDSHQSIPSPAEWPFVSHDTIPYPEWRINTVENARKAGMGDVGKAMAWVLWTEKGVGDSLMGNIRQQRQAFLQEMQYKTGIIPSDIYCGYDDEDDESEIEWEGWMRDLGRQGRVKRQSETATSRQAHIHSRNSSPVPSPLLEATSPGSPRVRSSSLSSDLAPSYLGWYTHTHTRYPNISNVVEATGAHGYPSTDLPRSPEWTKTSTIVSTVSVGTLPSPSRRRSSTLSSEIATTAKRGHDKGKQDGEPSPSASATSRAVSASAAMQCAPNTPTAVRHMHSSSNLKVPSSAACDAAESSGHAGPSSPSKHQSAFMRGVSARAGKIVRGLDSAIDFVDERTV